MSVSIQRGGFRGKGCLPVRRSNDEAHSLIFQSYRQTFRATSMPFYPFSIKVCPFFSAGIVAVLALTDGYSVYVCNSGRAFSTKLSELHEQVKLDCTPILACFDVGSESKHQQLRTSARFSPSAESPLPSPSLLRREITFSSESDESYGLQLLSRIASDLQVEEGVKLIIPVAIVQPQRKDSHDEDLERVRSKQVSSASFGLESESVATDDSSDIIDAQLMLQCLDAGALDVVRSPLDKAGIMGLTVHAYRIYKDAKKEQTGFMARRSRKQSWVGMEEEQPYAYLREAMVKKLLKGICEPQNIIEDYQHRDLYVHEARKGVIAQAVGSWDFCGHDFSEDELVYAGYFMLNHALQMDAVETWRMNKSKSSSRVSRRLSNLLPSRTTSFHARLSSRVQLVRPLPQLQTCR